MLNRIYIIEKSSGHSIANYPIILKTADICDCFYESWGNAVNDGLVDEGNKEDFVLAFVEDIPRE